MRNRISVNKPRGQVGLAAVLALAGGLAADAPAAAVAAYFSDTFDVPATYKPIWDGL
jgi:hypothetical protein